jgi:CBS-domain-containing membrane protein
MENLPKDPIILMSFINMKLRDLYPSLEALCEDLDIDRSELEEKLKTVGYEYDEANKRFW